MRRVRDREAPGSNPGPPTKIRIQIAVLEPEVGANSWTSRFSAVRDIPRRAHLAALYAVLRVVMVEET